MPLKPVEGNGDVCIRLGKAEVLVGLSIGNQRVFVHSFLAGSVFAVSKMGGARDETIFFDFQGLGSADVLGAPWERRRPRRHLGTPTSRRPVREANARRRSARRRSGFFVVFPFAMPTGTSAFPRVPTRRRRSRGNRRIRQRFGRIRHSVVATSGHGGKSS